MSSSEEDYEHMNKRKRNRSPVKHRDDSFGNKHKKDKGKDQRRIRDKDKKRKPSHSRYIKSSSSSSDVSSNSSKHNRKSKSKSHRYEKEKKEKEKDHLRKERRKHKYDDEVDKIKEKELSKRKDYEKQKCTKEDPKKEENEKALKKEKEMTEEEKIQYERRKRKALANVVVMMEKEESKKREEQMNKVELEEDFLSKDVTETKKSEIKKNEEENEQMKIEEEKINQSGIKYKGTEKQIILKENHQENDYQKEMNQDKPQNDNDEDDPYEAYLKTIEKDATLQDYQVIQLMSNQQLQKQYDQYANDGNNDYKNQNYETNGKISPDDIEVLDTSKVITFDDILNKKYPLSKSNEEENDDEEFYQVFMQSIKNKEVPLNTVDTGSQVKRDAIIYQEDANEFLKENEYVDLEDKWMTLKKNTEKGKELKLVNHSEMNYQPFRKNLYIVTKEISSLTDEQVEKIRKEKGDIKVRGKNIPKPILNWYHCGLSEVVLSVLEKKEFKEPFPIQCQAIPCIMSGRDVIGIAETGSGKTLAYVLPMLRHVMDQRPLKEGEGPIALLLAPTRELAVQIYSEIRMFTKHIGLKITCAYGGSGIGPQISELRRGVEIVVATPGRLIEILCLSNGKITNLKRVTYVVLDEADRMFDMGFEPQIARILANIRPDRQTVMFSATFPRQIENLAKKILTKPIEIIVGQRGQSAKSVEQHVEIIPQERSFIRLLEILGLNPGIGTLVFVDTKDEAIELWKQLFTKGYQPLLLHGGMDQEDRIDSIDKFKKGVSNILISTSVSARGLDVKHCGLVINFRCPNHMEDYVHRVGRTGRAGRSGIAYTFISPDKEAHLAEDVLKVLEVSNQAIPSNLRELVRNYKAKVESGEAEKFKISGYVGKGFQFNFKEQEKIKIERKALGTGYGLNESDEDDSPEVKGALDADEDLEKNKTALAIRQPSLQSKQDEKMKLLAKDLRAKQIAIDVGMNAAKNAIISGKSEEEVLEIAQEAIAQALSEYRPSVSTEKGIEQAAKIIESWEERENEKNHIYTCDFEINDYPTNARGKAIKREFLKIMSEMNDVDVTCKGIFVEPGKKPPVGQKKLFLHIKGNSQANVQSAYAEIKRTLDETALMYYTMGSHSGYGGNTTRYQI